MASEYWETRLRVGGREKMVQNVFNRWIASAAVATFFLAFGVSGASAQDAVCGMNTKADVERIYEEIVGHWQATNGPGYMRFQGGPTMPVGSSEPEYIRMWTDDGVLIGSNAGGPADYEIVFEAATDQPAWQFRSREQGGEVLSPTLTDQELEVVMDCSIEDLPRLIGRADIAVPTGVMHLTVRLVYLGEIGMYGIGEWETVIKGRQAIIRKPVTMSREQ